ncbi:sarcosine oxidase subunit gamma [Parasedimentitalea maritima]|uniref:Sarcosine oxidase subunit gamma n=1 Tax=Parasedimentitalea maritima TaxID=2578117 RepID=A0A5R8Z4F5_9RHOB|nr:sarcosine oxidase subunit gamma family protein [Zongyanglinia marina]KAE9631529.1 sarcosine oxidase subunit gamma [Zongyanglinia marina]TLP60454.1 sarcosine oxidase subunit gamma [Zongyanglinia marina]
MSDPVSALNGAAFSGMASVTEGGLAGMITLRGDLSSAKLKDAVKSATGAAMPVSGKVELSEDGGLCWMSPDELLVLVRYEEVEAKLAEINAGLKGEHALAANVSDARAVFRVSGEGAREVLAKLCPVDMSVDAFVPGQFRRTRMAQVAAAFWLDHDETFHIVCFRSVADYVFTLLSTAAQPQSEVGVY